MNKRVQKKFKTLNSFLMQNQASKQPLGTTRQGERTSQSHWRRGCGGGKWIGWWWKGVGERTFLSCQVKDFYLFIILIGLIRSFIFFNLMVDNRWVYDGANDRCSHVKTHLQFGH